MGRQRKIRPRNPDGKRRMRPLRSPEEGPDLPRVEAQACDCRSVIAECQSHLAELSDHCAACIPRRVAVPYTPDNSASA
jgi:hypothetical protein